MASRIRTAVLLLAGLALAASLVVLVFDSLPTAEVPSPPASPEISYNQLFTEYGERAGCADWSGADGTQSIALPGGDRAWFFSDTFLGPADQRVGGIGKFIRNSVVIQRGTQLRTITGGGTCSGRSTRTPVVDATDRRAFYWSGDGKVLGGNVVKFYYRNVPRRPLWIETHTAIAVIPISQLQSGPAMRIVPTLLPRQTSYGEHPVIWGAALLDWDGYTYVYGWGVADSHTNKKLYLARVRPNLLTDPSEWQYRSGDGWSDDKAEPVADSLHVDAGFSVVRERGSFWLIQKEPNLDGGSIVAHPAKTPWGFGTKRVTLYTPPEGPRDAAHKYQFTYEARVHPGLSGDPDRLIVSYNVNTSAVSAECRSQTLEDPSIYRPRFIDVPVSLLDSSRAKRATSRARPDPSASSNLLDGWRHRCTSRGSS